MPTVKAVAAALMDIPGLMWHIVVADNASTDETAKRVLSSGLPYVSVLSVPGKGKGRAIRAAALESQGADIFGFIDADLSADPAAIRNLIWHIERGYDIAIGSRLLNRQGVRRGRLRTASSLLFNALRKSMLGIAVADSQCGLKLMNRKGIEILRHCKEDTWFLDIEFLACAQRRGMRVVEVPIQWDEHHYPDRVSKLSMVRDGASVLQAFMRIKNRMRNLS